MKKYLFAFLATSLSLIACQHEEANPRSSCVEQFLMDNNLLAYAGQNLGCDDIYVLLFELDGKEYFCSECPCADMLSIPIDCDEIPYCPSVYSPELEYFFNNAVNKGIVGVKP